MIAKKVTSAGLDRFIVKMIRKSDKAPPGFHRIRQVAGDTAKDLKTKGKKFKIPWLLLLILIGGVIGIYWFVTSFKRPDEGGYSPGERSDEPIDLKGRDTKGLLDDFGYK